MIKFRINNCFIVKFLSNFIKYISFIINWLLKSIKFTMPIKFLMDLQSCFFEIFNWLQLRS